MMAEIPTTLNQILNVQHQRQATPKVRYLACRNPIPRILWMSSVRPVCVCEDHSLIGIRFTCCQQPLSKAQLGKMLIHMLTNDPNFLGSIHTR